MTNDHIIVVVKSHGFRVWEHVDGMGPIVLALMPYTHLTSDGTVETFEKCSNLTGYSAADLYKWLGY
jgi:hypothetical protein